MAVANTLAYYNTTTITAVKSFVVQVSVANATKPLIIWHDKLERYH